MNKQPFLLHSLTPIQKRYLADRNHRYFINSSGRRSRKTLSGIHKIRHFALKNQEYNVIHGAPTFNQAKKIFWNDKFGVKAYYRGMIKNVNNTDLTLELYNGTTVMVMGFDTPQRAEGFPINAIHFTETADIKPETWFEHVKPALDQFDDAFAIMDGVPEGRNWYYDLALKACGGFIPDTVPMEGAFGENANWAFYSWFSSDVLSPERIAEAKEDLDERTYKQEYEGAFVSFEGLAYYAFGDHNIKECSFKPNYPVLIGMDFNVDPMTAVICQYINGVLYQFDEVRLNNSNTYEMAEYLRNRYNPYFCTIYPDGSFTSKSTSTTTTDCKILEDYHFNIKWRRQNPQQKDRVNTVNSWLKSVSGKSRLIIDPKCKHTINDFNKVERLKDGRLNKSQEKYGLVHQTDALGYLIYGLDKGTNEAFFGGII